jgi:nicotinamide riboside kinase
MSALKKIAIIGVESSGKTTWCSKLASQFNEPFVPEYAREYLTARNGLYSQKDLWSIAQGQISLEKDYEKKAQEFLFCDTDIANIQIWSEFKYNACDVALLQLVATTKYDAYVLTPLLPDWEYDVLRENPEFAVRTELYQFYLEYALSTQKPILIMNANTTLDNFVETLHAKL